MNGGIGDRTAIVGIGATEFSKDSGRSELQLAVECIKAALDDCGLTPADVTGLAGFSMDTNLEIEVANNLGIPELTFFSRIEYGGGAGCGGVAQAALAVAGGAADVVVCYRALNERSGHRFGADISLQPVSGPMMALMAYGAPCGLMTAGQFAAMYASRYLHQYGRTTDDFGRVSVTFREHAANNPNAFFRDKPITLDDHRNSRLIAEPLRMLDCCQESDGGVALVITSAERAREMPRRPALIRAAAQGAATPQGAMTSFYRDDIATLPESGVVARKLYGSSGLGPKDIDAAIIYDHFTPYVLGQLEEFGFCGRGEAGDFVADGHLGLGGSLPTNTNGGQLGEAYIHGMNGIAEAVRLLRGESCNQVADIANIVVTSGAAVPTSGLILAAP
ncbi:MAG TPA: lipid-transfer protein [Pseudonocardia sp.]|nr:lipid-transfer protein [Pseudonocardia sp.]